MTVGQCINAVRKRKKMTVQQLADESDISINTIVSWMYHDHHPDIVLLCSVADALNVTLDELIGRKFP